MREGAGDNQSATFAHLDGPNMLITHSLCDPLWSAAAVSLLPFRSCGMSMHSQHLHDILSTSMQGILAAQKKFKWNVNLYDASVIETIYQVLLTPSLPSCQLRLCSCACTSRFASERTCCIRATTISALSH